MKSIESLEANPPICGQKQLGAETVQWGKNKIFNKRCWKIGYPYV